VPGASEAGDRFGAALTVGTGCDPFEPTAIAIGAPGEGIGSAAQAGSITLLPSRVDVDPYSDDCPLVFRQGLGFSGAPETGDHFGAAIGELAVPYTEPSGLGHVDGGGSFVVGAPGEDLGAATDAGVLESGGGVFRDSTGPRSGEQYGNSPAWSLPNYTCFC
jgi:hypothetical protein